MQAFPALAEPTRLRIVEMLAASGRLAVSDIGKKFPISAPAISQHLKILRDANLVRMEIRAQQRIYSINPAGIDAIEHWVNHMRHFWEQRFDALDRLLQTEMKKPKPKIKKGHKNGRKRI